MAKRIGRLNAIATANTGAFENGMRRMSRSINMSARSAGMARAAMATFTRTVLPMIGVTLTGAAAVRSLVGAFRDLDSLAKQSRQLRITVSELRGFRLAASEAGIEASTLDRGIDALNRRMGRLARGSNSTAQGLELLGLSAEEMLRLSPSERFLEIATAIDRIGADTDRTTAALEQLFGRSGTGMLNLFRQGADEIERSIGLVNELGGEITAKMAGRIEKANDTMARFRIRMGAARDAIAIGIAPVIEDISQSLLDWLGPADDFNERIANIERAARRVFAVFKGITALVMAGNAGLSDISIRLQGMYARLHRFSLRSEVRNHYAILEDEVNEANKANQKALKNAQDLFQSALDGFNSAGREAQKSVDKFNTPPASNELERWFNSITQSAAELRGEFDEIANALDPSAEAMRNYERMLETVNEAHEAGIISAEEFAKVSGEIQEKLNDTELSRWFHSIMDAATEMREGFDDLTASLDPAIAQSRRYAEMMDLINEAHEAGIISAREYADARAAIFRDANSDLINEAERLEKSLRTPFERIQDELKDAEHLFRMGFIGEETLQRAVRNAQDQIKDLVETNEQLEEQDPFQEMTDSAKEYERQLQRVFALIRGEATTGAAGSIRLGPSAQITGGELSMPDSGIFGAAGLSSRRPDSPLSAPDMSRRQEREGLDPGAVQMMIEFLGEIARNTREQRAVL